ncbi:transketolase [Chlamydia trachomatis]|uniref:Transketolase n=1 Tax=Chlamydia trachomatis serovar D (strain ATCC VR-885 / DSM 19411 / UW-3/Cx) TaxID=272561 RepID=O84755_CHLTR|nr:transketolase [Chlamydia trachomatis]NP_220269.1 transketolase [Chlamydia trachomatis D/UW-3/CX]AAC68345.1 Transketolase [Chlamydia trachomatis D/UW-3/CX]ADH17549.1 transketolase [Chlamydia trachomatis E/150]ADH18472.1 transketolase [Chlamydia trachomatis G/9768]ADH19397.1 transketolase [Chlamydia trachomatis G/11222]ADH20318.1 transketolase [Chlamydia trachomatis G/11074]
MAGNSDLDIDILEKIAGTIKQLSIESIQKASSGHPGMPLGCAELAAYLYGYVLRYNSKDSRWVNRDRFVLSAGHGSALLYSCLHLAGFDVNLEDLQQFRQLQSRTPGHPEFRETDGVEATTGPLGQGVGNAVGMALSLKMLGARFNQPANSIFDAKVYCLAGDGCFMEGVSHEACSFAGSLGLDNLVLIYDHNEIILDGTLHDVSIEDTKQRFLAYGWDVFETDGHDFESLHQVFTQIKKSQCKPTLIIAHTIIGHGSPKEGTNKAHGSPLGEDGVAQTKSFWHLPEEKFFVPSAVKMFFAAKQQEGKKLQEEWQERFRVWSKQAPEQHQEYLRLIQEISIQELEEILNLIDMPESIAGRAASNKVIQVLAEDIPSLVGGSADLSSSDGTWIAKEGTISASDFLGRNIRYGVREFGMGTIMNGLAYSQVFRPFGGTFLVFSDYLRSAIRLAALSKLPVIYQFTHDSIFVGEDGPTHQPIEQIMSLRAIPGLRVIRPADANEVKGAWLAALESAGPTALILSRQNLPTLKETKRSFREGVRKGAYILVKEEGDRPDYTLCASGSEVHLAIEVAQSLMALDNRVRVISFPCWELFERQDVEYRESVIGGDLGLRVSIEAGTALGWYKYIGSNGLAIAMDGFGMSGAPNEVAETCGFTVDNIVQRILSV